MDNTLSIVPSEGSSDFPVLKAFQEYIDAEQAKARKRMLGLSVFFIILLVVVVVTFVLVLTTVVNRNQALSDRLLDYALNERRREVVIPQQVVQQPQVPAASMQDMMKPLIERFEREQAAMKAAYEQQQKEAKALAEAREKARAEELEKARIELQRERSKAKKEADAQAAKERHLRRLYPDYYSQRDEAPSYQPSRKIDAPQNAPRERPASKSANAQPSAKKQSALSDMKPVTYFNSDDDDGVPFLLETPQKSR